MNHSVQLNSRIPAELADEFVKRLPYVSESLVAYELNEETCDNVRFRLTPGHDQDLEVVSSRIVEVADKLCKARRQPASKVLISRKNGDFSYRADPHPQLEAMDEIHRFGDGRFGLGPRLVELMDIFD